MYPDSSRHGRFWVRAPDHCQRVAISPSTQEEPVYSHELGSQGWSVAGRLAESLGLDPSAFPKDGSLLGLR